LQIYSNAKKTSDFITENGKNIAFVSKSGIFLYHKRGEFSRIHRELKIMEKKM